MDIYEYGENINFNADYYDTRYGFIYKLQEFKKIKDDPRARIRVTDTEGKTIGYAKRKGEV